MTTETWSIPPELTTLRIGTASLSWEDTGLLDQALDDLLAERAAHERVPLLYGAGHTLVCPDPAAAAAARRRLVALGLDLELGPPRWPQRESVGGPVVQRGRYVRQAGAEQFGIVDLRLTPLPGGGVVRYRCDLPADGPISAEFLPAVARGVRRAVLAGGPRGYPLANLAVTLVGGVEHPVDSRPGSFEWAARLAMLQALEAAGVLLEPAEGGAGYRVVSGFGRPG